MPLLTIEQCRRQCRVDGDYDDVILDDLLASAEDAAGAFLNRMIFADQNALDASWSALPDAAAASALAHAEALVAAAAEADPTKAKALVAVADERLAAHSHDQEMMLSGVVANGSILAAIRLTLGHLYANREEVVIGATAAELPMGAKALLRPYRKVMGP